MRILIWKNKYGHTYLCFGKFNTLVLLFFCSVQNVTVSVRMCTVSVQFRWTRWTRFITRTAKMIKMAWGLSRFISIDNWSKWTKIWTIRLKHTRCNISRRTNFHTLFKYGSLFVLLPAESIKQHWNRIGILVHLEKQAGFQLITTILAIAKK